MTGRGRSVGRRRWRPPQFAEAAYDFEFGGDGTTIVVGNDATLTVFDIATGEQLRQIASPRAWSTGTSRLTRPEGSPHSFQHSRSGSTWSTSATGEVRGTVELRGPIFAEVQPDGRVVAITDESGLIRLYDTDEFVERERLVGSSGAPTQIYFTPDGSRCGVGHDRRGPYLGHLGRPLRVSRATSRFQVNCSIVSWWQRMNRSPTPPRTRSRETSSVHSIDCAAAWR